MKRLDVCHIKTGMNLNPSHDEKKRLKERGEPTPVLFFVMLAIIAASILVFLFLSPIRLGTGTQ